MMGDTLGRCMGPVSGAKGIIDIDISQLSQLGGKLRVLSGLEAIESSVSGVE